ncbi:hypothetical protein DFP72DRAFT_1106979 [Ephemerocybe angulata]|uniref:Uncharacterized protein n=1 Tax=Ephemerocybe angulata TaxID=980116 RepID=A0A8H6MBT4_9AGAR|nr:hypothetical protein DFP72DRAFT_1106979 [Tulosesus angulatus]
MGKQSATSAATVKPTTTLMEPGMDSRVQLIKRGDQRAPALIMTLPSPQPESTSGFQTMDFRLLTPTSTPVPPTYYAEPPATPSCQRSPSPLENQPPRCPPTPPGLPPPSITNMPQSHLQQKKAETSGWVREEAFRTPTPESSRAPSRTPSRASTPERYLTSADFALPPGKNQSGSVVPDLTLCIMREDEQRNGFKDAASVRSRPGVSPGSFHTRPVGPCWQATRIHLWNQLLLLRLPARPSFATIVKRILIPDMLELWGAGPPAHPQPHPSPDFLLEMSAYSTSSNVPVSLTIRAQPYAAMPASAPPSPWPLTPSTPASKPECEPGFEPAPGTAENGVPDLVHLNKFTAPPPAAPLPGQGFSLPVEFPGGLSQWDSEADLENEISDVLLVEPRLKTITIFLADVDDRELDGIEELEDGFGGMRVGECESEGEEGVEVELSVGEYLEDDDE